MSTSDDRKPSLPDLLRRLLANSFPEWLSFALDVIQQMRQWLCKSPTAPYEILDYEATVEILDATGAKAIFRKRQRVKFLQNGVIAFEDYTWGDGEILADYKCTPGVVVDKYREGDRWNILVSLHDTKSAGDTEQFHIEQRLRNTYLKEEEWFQTEIRRPTRHLVMNVIFPKERHCRRAVLMQRGAGKSIELGPEYISHLPDGRQMVSWETTHTRTYEMYTLKWRW